MDDQALMDKVGSLPPKRDTTEFPPIGWQEMLAAASHNLMNDARIVLDFARMAQQILQMKVPDLRRVNEFHSGIVEHANRLCAGLENLNHIRAPREDESAEPTSLKDLAEAIDNACSVLPWPRRKLRLVLSMPPSPDENRSKTIRRNQLRHLLFIVFGNALKYACPKTAVEVRLRTTHSDAWEIAVSNCFPPRELRISKDRSDIGLSDSTAKRANLGLGFGLPIATRMAALNGWMFAVITLPSDVHEHHPKFVATLTIPRKVAS